MVTQWNATNIISRHDVFKMLKLIYASRLSVYQQNNAEVYSGIFQETILQLEKVEEALEQIANREAPTREEFNQSVKENDQEQIARIISFYQNLRVDERLHDLGLKNHRYSGIVHSFDNLPGWGDGPFLTTEREVAWNSKNFPQNEVFGFVEMLQDHLKKHQTHIRHQLDSNFKKYSSHVENLNQLLNINKRLYATCFDIEITSRNAYWKDDIQNYLSSAMETLDFEMSLTQVLDLRAYYLTLEVNENGAFKIFLVVLQNKAEKLHTNALSLERALKQHFQSLDSIRFPFDINALDISKSIQKRCHPKAVGSISSLTALRQFQYWILGYLYFRGMYLQPHFDNYPETIIEFYFEDKIHSRMQKEVLAEVETLPPEVKRMPEKRDPPTRFEQIDLSKQQVQIWSDSGLPAKAKTYLKLVELLYKEQHAQQPLRHTEDILNIMLDIEKFMQTLLHYPALAFDYPNHQFERVQQNPGRYLTQVAKQFLEIAWALQKPDPILLITAQSIGSVFVDSLLRSYSDSRYSANHLFQWLINPRGFRAFTNLLMHFKSEGKYLYSSTIETSKRNTVAKNKAEAYKYLRVIMKQDVLAVRFIFSVRLSRNKDHDQNAFRAWITDFIKNIKRRPRAIGAELLGYIGTYLYNQRWAVDIVLLFHVDAVGEVDQSIANAIQQYWQNYIVEKQKNIEKQKLKIKKETTAATSTASFPYMAYFEGAKLVAEQHPVMASIRQLNAMGLIINSYNRSLKNLFIKSLADYFSGYCLICLQGPGESSGSSGFFKGSLSRSKKPETSKKQAKATKPVQAEDSKQKALAGQKPHQYSYTIAQQRIAVYPCQSIDGSYAPNSESILKSNPKSSTAIYYSSALSNAE